MAIMSLGKSTAMAAALLASASAFQPVQQAIIPARVQTLSQPASRKKRKLAPKRTPVIWRGSMAEQYGSRRNFAAGSASTLKKTAKLLRLQAAGGR
ncbi:hypothetical protein NKJ35_24320 [Mesorhizobium sp. M0136]|uniref:hypothetical protein n=1 Tax=Mesorhizobium sp. M0136 TaxID=2956890 RepID=UPI00333CF0C6